MSRYSVLLLVLVIMVASSLIGVKAAPAVEWEVTLPNSGDEARSIIQTNDGGYVVVGSGNSKDGIASSYLFKLDANGNMQWNTSCGTGVMTAVVQANDGGYASAGIALFIKMDSEGNKQWDIKFSETTINSLVTTRDNGYALGGYMKGDEYTSGIPINDFWLAKVDYWGTLLWNKTFGGYGDEKAFSVVQTLDGGYALAGKSESTRGSKYNFWLVKTDPNGNMEWNKTYGGTRGDSQANSIIQTEDGGYMLAGNTNAVGAGLSDAWLIKTSSSGTMMWNRTYGGTGELPDFYGTSGVPPAGSDGSTDDYANSLIQTSDGGLAFVGASYATWSTLVWLVKTDSAGNAQWNTTYGSFGGFTYEFFGKSLIETSDGAFTIAGYRTTPGFPWHGEYYIIKTEAVLPIPTPGPTYPPTPSPTPNYGQEPFPTALAIAIAILVIIAALALVVVILAKLLLYWKKR